MDKMIRFLLGISLVQLATVVLVLMSPDLEGVAWLRLFIPLAIVGVFTSFWFASMAKHKIKDEVTAACLKHASEKEKIQLNAERAKTRLVQKTQQQIAREGKITHGKANFKVGAAFAGTIGAGVLMLFIELLTMGLLTMSTAGGALGGYLLRARKGDKRLAHYEAKQALDAPVKVIKGQ